VSKVKGEPVRWGVYVHLSKADANRFNSPDQHFWVGR
jgi:hypothetical protein